MNLGEIRAFVTVVESGSVQRAAQLLHLTQPAVTRQVQRLEETLGVTLLNRRSKPPALTPQGRAALERCRQVLQAVEGLFESVSPSGEPTGELRLGVSHGVAWFALSEPVDALRRRFPALSFTVVSGWSRPLIAQAQAGAIDAAAVLLPASAAPPKGLVGAVVGDDRMVIIAAADAVVTPPVSLLTLAGQSWVVNPEGCSYRDALNSAVASTGQPLKVAAEVYDQDLQLSLVARGVGFGLVSATMLRTAVPPPPVRIVDAPELNLMTAIWVLRAPFLGRLTRAIDSLQNSMTEFMQRSALSSGS